MSQIQLLDLIQYAYFILFGVWILYTKPFSKNYERSKKEYGIGTNRKWEIIIAVVIILGQISQILSIIYPNLYF
jgi:hypothetical protein